MADDHRFYGLVGDPITHVRSPGILNAYLIERGLPGRMVPLGIKARRLKAAVEGLRHLENLHGFFVTMPHKETILPLLDEATETASISGAVNIVRRTSDGRLIGHQLDGAGFVGAMKLQGIAIKGKSAYIAGAGGVSAGICCALAQDGVGSIMIANRNRDRAEALAMRLGDAFADTEFVVTQIVPSTDIDIVVNATSLGTLPDHPQPIDLSNIRQGAFVGDVINVPHRTALLEDAEKRGCRIQNGSAMFGPQIELALHFLGQDR